MSDLIPFWAWSWLLTAVGVTGLLLAGSKRKVGWAIGLGAQVLWIAYALATMQWGFIASALAYGSVYLRNWWKWHREQNPKFGVTEFSSYPRPNRQGGHWSFPRATARGTGPAEVGEQFTHDGVRMVVTAVHHPFDGTGLSWEAMDLTTWTERNTIRDSQVRPRTSEAPRRTPPPSR